MKLDMHVACVYKIVEHAEIRWEWESTVAKKPSIALPVFYGMSRDRVFDVSRPGPLFGERRRISPPSTIAIFIS